MAAAAKASWQHQRIRRNDIIIGMAARGV